MAESNIDLFHRGVEAFNRRDKAAWMATSHPDLVNVPPKEWPEARVITGAEAVWDFLVENLSTFEETTIEPAGDILERGDTLMAHIKADVRGRSSGAELTFDYFEVIQVKDGVAARLSWFSDRDEALAAAGLSEPVA